MPQWSFVVSMMVLALVAELLQIDLYSSGSVSVSVTMMVAAALIGGTPAVIPLAAAIAVGAAVARRRMHGRWPPLHRVIFNWSVHILAGSLLALVVGGSGLSLALDTLPLLLTVVVAASIAYAVIETGLVAIAVALSERQRLISLWSTRYRWLLLHYVVLCVMGLFLAITYTYLGYAGLTVFLLPVLMMRYAQKQYVAHTNSSISELRFLNDKLNNANQTILAANDSVQRLNQDLVSANASVALLNDELFITLARIIDARDPAVASHSARVASLALALARASGLSDERQVQLYRAALLHDIGKIGIAEHILRKPGRLTPEEFAVVKTHALLGATLLASSQHLRPLVPFVRHHHERWDGCGYPDGLANEAIPLEARILAICDAVEVMTSDRPYREQLSTAAVLIEVERCSGTHFDPHLASCFIELVRQGEIVLESYQFADTRMA